MITKRLTGWRRYFTRIFWTVTLFNLFTGRSLEVMEVVALELPGDWADQPIDDLADLGELASVEVVPFWSGFSD